MAETKISSNFGHVKSVAKGVKVTYELLDYDKTRFAGGGGGYGGGEEGSLYDWQWYVTFHHLDDDGKDSESWIKNKDDAGNSTHSLVFTKKWDKVGRHLVLCQARDRRTKKFVPDGGHVQFRQQVEELEAILERQMAGARKGALPNPYTELTMLWKWLALLDGLGKAQGSQMSPSVRKEHEKRIAELEATAERLKALLAKCDEENIYPFRAVYLAKESMEEKELRVFVTHPRGSKDRLMIVDWTNLNEPKLHGTYEAKLPAWKGRRTSAVVREGLKNAVETWESQNRYWPGGIRYEIKWRMGGDEVAVQGTITTGDTSWKEDLADILKKIAAGAGMIALVLTGIGSVYAGAMVVTAMVAGGTGSVLSIHHRHSRGQESFIDDATDVLDIVGNVFGLGYRAGAKVLWRAGATLKNLKVGKRVVDALFIGEVFADGFNGVLLGVDFVKRYNEIMDAKGMSPEQRAQALLDLFGSAAQAGVMVGLNHKVTSSIEKADWSRLLDDTRPLDLSDASSFKGERSGKQPADTGDVSRSPTFKGDTKDGKKQVTVVATQQRHPPAAVAPPKTKEPIQWPKRKDDPAIWAKYEITDDKIRLETKDGFHFTASIDHNGYVHIDVRTKVNDKHSPHLGTGRENYDRMFRHFEEGGHPIKGWTGIFIDDNYAAVKQAMKDNPRMTPAEAVLDSVSGKYFWKPWADSQGHKLVVEDAQDIGSFFSFDVRVERK